MSAPPARWPGEASACPSCVATSFCWRLAAARNLPIRQTPPFLRNSMSQASGATSKIGRKKNGRNTAVDGRAAGHAPQQFIMACRYMYRQLGEHRETRCTPCSNSSRHAGNICRRFWSPEHRETRCPPPPPACAQNVLACIVVLKPLLEGLPGQGEVPRAKDRHRPIPRESREAAATRQYGRCAHDESGNVREKKLRERDTGTLLRDVAPKVAIGTSSLT